MQGHLPNPFFCFILLLTSNLLNECKAGPASVVKLDEGFKLDEGLEAVDATINQSYPEMENRLMKRLVRGLLPSANRWPIPLHFWNHSFENREEACAAVDAFMATTEDNGCQSSYECDYDKGRWPSTLISLQCSRNTLCRATPYTSYPRESCSKREYYLTVAQFQEDKSVSSLQQPELPGERQTGNELKGQWKRKRIIKTVKCFCK